MPVLAGQTILVVDDESLIALDIADALQSDGAATIVATTIDDAMQRSCERGITCAVVDHKMRDQTTETLCAALRANGVPVVLHTGYQLRDTDAAVVLPKPATREMIIAAVTKALARN